MRSTSLLMHGEDSKRFKYYPKFLGLCLSKLQALQCSSSGVTVPDFISKINSFKETAVDRDRLKNIYTNIKKDEWSLLEAETDTDTLLEGILGFLRSFSETET